nr:hypothetical protein [Tanacetum cinerariifolium]
MIAILEKSDAAQGFEQIIDFLTVVKRSGDVTRLQALVDKKRIVISEEVVREILQLNDAKGVDCLPNEEIFAGLACMGYEKLSTKLTFYKAFFSTQWKFIQLIIQSNIANFSKHTNRYISPVLTQKVFANMQRVGKGFSRVETPLFETMLTVRDIAEEAEAQIPAQDDDVQEHAAEEVATDVVLPNPTSPSPSSLVIPSLPPHQSPYLPHQQDAEARVKKLKKLNKGRISIDMETDEGIELVVDQEKNAEVEGRQADKQAEIYNIDLDHSSKVAATSKPIPAAKPKTLKIAAAPAVSTRRRKGVVIRDPEEELRTDTPAETPTVKDKGKGILIEDLKPMKKKDQNAAFDHVQSKETQYIKRYHGFKKKPQSESEARKNMISYLKNTEGYKMEFFKGKTYDQILPIFQARFDANLKFLFKTREEMEKEDEDIIKSINETPGQKAAKRIKLSEEAQEADDLRRHLEIVQDEDDDVFVEAIPLAQKVPVVDYQ